MHFCRTKQKFPYGVHSTQAATIRRTVLNDKTDMAAPEDIVRSRVTSKLITIIIYTHTHLFFCVGEFRDVSISE